MQTLVQIEVADRRLLEVIGSAMDEAVRRSGTWVVCRPGCTQCCLGPFPITMLDAMRLQDGLRALEVADPPRAARLRARAEAHVEAIRDAYPGNPTTGELKDADGLPDAFDDLPCPVLDAETGCCDLYDARPVTCRLFGPATKVGGDQVAACELCYSGATPEQIAACAVSPVDEALENGILDQLAALGISGTTTVAYAISRGSRR